MIKRLSYLCCGILGVLSTFFAYAKLGYKFTDTTPTTVKDQINTQLNENGNSVITFFEKIGDFRDVSIIKNHFDTVLSSLLVFVALICISVILTSAILSIIKQNNQVFEIMEIKKISIVGFASLFVALLLGLLINRLPESPNPVFIVEYTQKIGIGSILFLIASASSIAVSYFIKED